MNETIVFNISSAVATFDPTPLSEAVNFSFNNIVIESTSKVLLTVEIFLFGIFFILLTWFVFWLWFAIRKSRRIP